MPLVSIADIGSENYIDYLTWAEELKAWYDHFLISDDEDESFDVGWHSGKSRLPGIHASDLSGCQRKVSYSLLATEKKEMPKAIWKRKFRAGHLYHTMLQRDFHRMCARTGGAVTFQDEIKVDKTPVAASLDIHSSCDGAFTYLETQGGAPLLRVATEIKSASCDEWKNLKEPKPDHIEQATLYQKCLNIPLIWFIYYNKGTQAITPSKYPWLRPFDHDVWAKLEVKIHDRFRNRDEGSLPPRQEGIGCEFCPYSWTCNPKYLSKKRAIEAAKEVRSKTIAASRLIRAPKIGTPC